MLVFYVMGTVTVLPKAMALEKKLIDWNTIILSSLERQLELIFALIY